jgi:para-nitrobenzyl esterase
MRPAIAGVLIGSLLAGAAAHAESAGRTVRVEAGEVVGKFQLNTAVRAFLGIPFAAPPVGDLRWKPPQPAAAWRPARAATSYGAQCMQPARSKTSVYYEYAGDQPTSEDCLYLNVWAPSDAEGAKLPVMVWIYGGGFQQGSAANPVFDGSRLAHRGVIVVSINYRVGIFGFLAHPELTAESPQRASGNYGLLDQVAGLNWVKRNIAAFGGDPDNVTIFGQSAGAASVTFLFASPLARGLFARGISESFGFANKSMAGLAEAEKGGLDLAAKLNAPSLADLRQLPPEKLLETQVAMSPIVDGWFLPANPYTVFADGKEAPAGLLTGWNFGTLDGLNRDWTTADRMLSDRLQAYWVAYAYSGSPNAPGLPRWPSFRETTDSTMYLGDRTGPGPVPNLDRLELFDTLPSPFSGF